MGSKKIYKYFGVFLVLIFLGIYILSFIQPEVYTLSLWHRLLVTFRFIFVNEHNRLNWVGISAIGVMLSYVINSKFNRDKLRADLVSQSRMKWLDNVKEITTTFIKDVNLFNAKYIILLNKVEIYNKNKLQLQMTEQQYYSILNLKEKPSSVLERNVEILRNSFEISNKECGELSDELNDLQYKIIKNYLLIQMNFGTDKEDIEIINVCKDIKEEIKNFVVRTSKIQDESNLVKLIFESENRNDNQANKLDELSDILKIYYKKEWEKVKQGN